MRLSRLPLWELAPPERSGASVLTCVLQRACRAPNPEMKRALQMAKSVVPKLRIAGRTEDLRKTVPVK